ncbi:hypothetical protein BDV25DRAFT_135791 [Aspergillus avenaceus]|uniref:Uncharacterized protein n=1 Tax=Aspergillus avenaceus TaxID=36643 RepID=A0A5N6U7P4_ASPAV|nr:hypothetical protein BDV25DRAFT_135791 [Aspergillus avenaceus]
MRDRFGERNIWTCPICFRQFGDATVIAEHMAMCSYISRGFFPDLFLAISFVNIEPVWFCPEAWVQGVGPYSYSRYVLGHHGRWRYHNPDTLRAPDQQRQDIVNQVQSTDTDNHACKPSRFLLLPQELRDMIYAKVLCFEQIDFYSLITGNHCDTRSYDWAPADTRINPLALLSTNRYISQDAREVFYKKNKFRFHCTQRVMVFLVGIGMENAMMLRSVQWKDATGRFQERLGLIKPLFTGTHEDPESEEKNIWNNEASYFRLYATVRWPRTFEHITPQLLTPRPSELPLRYRYALAVVYKREGRPKQLARALFEVQSPSMISGEAQRAYNIQWRVLDRNGV